MSVRIPALALVLSLAAAGCASTTRHRLAYASPEGPAGHQCVTRCDHGDRDSDYFACIRKCPGVEVVDGKCQPADTSWGFCVEKHEKNAVGEVIGGCISLFFLIGGIYAGFD